jgi:hypothetical protein
MTSYAEADCIVLFDFETAFIRSLLTDLNEEFEGGTLHEWWFPEPSKLEYTNIVALSHWVKDGLREIDTPTYKLADFVDNGRTNSIHIMECIEHKPSIIRSKSSLEKYTKVIDRYLELRSDPQACADMYQELPLQVFAHQNGRKFLHRAIEWFVGSREAPEDYEQRFEYELGETRFSIARMVSERFWFKSE